MPRSTFVALPMLVGLSLSVGACLELERSRADAPRDAVAVLAARGSSACELTELVPSAELGASERGAFTTAGRFFVIGTLPEPTGDGLSWLLEIDETTEGYATTRHVRGTLEGTRDGTLGGEPVGAPCTFSGMTVRGDVLYAGCYASDGRASLLELDTLARTVRAGSFNTCNLEPAAQPCSDVLLYLNGMAVDGEGRLYATNMHAHGIGPGPTDYSVLQIELLADTSVPARLPFVFRAFQPKDLLRDGPAPNGIQVRDDVLYYVGGANINAVPIEADGRAGPLRVYYRGPALSMIDDFTIGDGQMVLARAFPANLGFLAAPTDGVARELATCQMPPLGMASSLTPQNEAAEAAGVFPRGSLLVTSFFGGGLYALSPSR
jgi:hypothetical protein